MRISFDFTDLEAFLVLFETGSFVVAARHLGMSQSALTRRIRKMEEGLGALLFQRTTRQVRPTLAAKRLRARSQMLVEEARVTMREFHDRTASHAFQAKAIVTVAAVPSAIPRLAIPAVGIVEARLAGVRIRILDMLANEVAEAVADGRADFGLSSLPVLEDHSFFEPLVEDRVVLTLPPSHPLAGEEAVRWDAMAGQRVILPMQGSGNRALIDRALAPHNLSLLWTYEVPRSTTALELVRAGLGIAPLPLLAVPESGALATCRLISPVVTRQVGIVCRKDARLSAAAAAMRETIVAEARRRAG